MKTVVQHTKYDYIYDNKKLKCPNSLLENTAILLQSYSNDARTVGRTPYKKYLQIRQSKT